LNLAATATFVVLVSRWQKDQVVQQLTQRLADSAALVRFDVLDDLPTGPTQSLQRYVRAAGAEIGTRVTLVDMKGVVLADSKRASLAEVAAMETHKHRPELVQAEAFGRGTSQRVSPTLGVPMLYVALRADVDDTPVGLVRTALPMTEVQAQVARIRRTIWLIALAVSLASVGLTYYVAARVVRPVRTLTHAAEAIAAGDYNDRVYFDSRDELGALAKSFHRMTDRLASRESELRESRQRLAIVLEGMAEGVISLDDRERILLANAAAGRLMGFSPAKSVGRPLLEVVRSHALHVALAESQESQEASRHLEIELGGGDNRVLSIYATVLAGEPTTRFILVVQDITELRRLELMRQEFVANVSHELKTPLSSIKAYAETLSGGAIDDQKNNRRFVHHIEDQAERLHQLIIDLLSLARIESGQQVADIGAVSIAKVVQLCIAEHQALADARKVRLVSCDADADLLVRADEEGVRQILTNLIKNAVSYTPDGGTVSVDWKAEESTAVIDVRDTGIGIDREHLPRLFERFYRVDKARSRELGGTGLGLAIVKHLSQSFGGGVEVESVPGKGSTFTVRLPRA
jgi:two-component system phosphate regulon sensor histidine kinase PhoR